MFQAARTLSGRKTQVFSNHKRSACRAPEADQTRSETVTLIGDKEMKEEDNVRMTTTMMATTRRRRRLTACVASPSMERN